MDKKRAWLLPILIASLTAIVYLSARRPRHTPAAAARAAGTAAAPAALSKPAPGLPGDAARLKDAAQQLDAALQAQRRPVRVQAHQTVVRVNGVTLTGRDLLPFKEGRGEQSMSPQRYDLLLHRAVERELVAQAARAQRLELDAAQRQQLAQMRQHAMEVRRISDPAQIEFEARDAESQILLMALGAQAGLPSPFATTQDVDRYYRDHRDAFDPLPKDPARRAAAWQAIQVQIRGTLSMEMQAAHLRGVRAYVEQLRAGARIDWSS